MKKSKSHGQVFTPEYIVNLILDNIAYNNENIINKTILEPSFGDGAFIIKIIERFIKVCEDVKIDKNKTLDLLNKNIYGIEIDEELYNQTIIRLNTYLVSKGYSSIQWDNLHLGDTLKYNKKNDFDYIVGNPPYIRIHNLDNDTRNSIKNFIFSKGTTDLYVIFFEKCLNMLHANGKLCFITPNSFMKNTSQKLFRKYLIENNLIEKLIDFKDVKVFDNASTYVAITLLNNNKNSNNFIYSEHDNENLLFSTTLSTKDLNNEHVGEPWFFSTKENNEMLKKIFERKNKLEDICTIQYGVATNKDAIYISKISIIKNDEKNVIFNGYEIEKNILRPVVKGSTYKGINDNTMIIFPYEWNDEKECFIALNEADLKRVYPLAYKYLLDHKKTLEQRDMDDDATWYQYARSQGLTNSKYQKLMVKNVFNSTNENLETFILPAETIVYSGIFIVADELETLLKVKSIIETKEFCQYCKIIGKDMQGAWKNINTKNIKNYGYKK